MCVLLLLTLPVLDRREREKERGMMDHQREEEDGIGGRRSDGSSGWQDRLTPFRGSLEKMTQEPSSHFHVEYK